MILQHRYGILPRTASKRRPDVAPQCDPYKAAQHREHNSGLTNSGLTRTAISMAFSLPPV